MGDSGGDTADDCSVPWHAALPALTGVTFPRGCSQPHFDVRIVLQGQAPGQCFKGAIIIQTATVLVFERICRAVLQRGVGGFGLGVGEGGSRLGGKHH